MAERTLADDLVRRPVGRPKKVRDGEGENTKTKKKKFDPEAAQAKKVTGVIWMQHDEFRSTDLPILERLFKSLSYWYAFGFEIGSANENEHIHFIVNLKKRCMIPGGFRRNVLSDPNLSEKVKNCHTEKVMFFENCDWYTKKDGNVVEWGDKSAGFALVPNHRTGAILAEIEDAVVHNDNPMLRMLDGEYAGELLQRFNCVASVAKLMATKRTAGLPARRPFVETILLHGAPRTGKTYAAMRLLEQIQNSGGTTLVINSGYVQEGKFWVQECDLTQRSGACAILIDEVAHKFPAETLLQLLDPYRLTAQVKNEANNYQFYHILVLVTHQEPDDNWYIDKRGIDELPPGRREALRERFKKRIFFDHRDDSFRIPISHSLWAALATIFNVHLPIGHPDDAAIIMEPGE